MQLEQPPLEPRREPLELQRRRRRNCSLVLLGRERFGALPLVQRQEPVRPPRRPQTPALLRRPQHEHLREDEAARAHPPGGLRDERDVLLVVPPVEVCYVLGRNVHRDAGDERPTGPC